MVPEQAKGLLTFSFLGAPAPRATEAAGLPFFSIGVCIRRPRNAMQGGVGTRRTLRQGAGAEA